MVMLAVHIDSTLHNQFRWHAPQHLTAMVNSVGTFLKRVACVPYVWNSDARFRRYGYGDDRLKRVAWFVIYTLTT